MQENPAVIFPGVTDAGQAWCTTPGMWYMVIVWPGWFNIQESQTVFTAFLKGPNTPPPLSKGCSLCDVCGGNDSNIIPFALLKSRTSMKR